MKQYTTPEQTAKLIELGFEKPKSIRYPKNEKEAERVNTTDFLISDYSIGELIEMLPKSISHPHKTSLNFCLAISFLQSKQWYVDYETCDSALCSATKSELIDTLYDMIIKLKEEGVI